MHYRFTQNLGSADAAECSKLCDCKIDHTKCVADAVVDLPKDAAEWLTKKYPGLIEQEDKLKAVAKEPAITGVPHADDLKKKSA